MATFLNLFDRTSAALTAHQIINDPNFSGSELNGFDVSLIGSEEPGRVFGTGWLLESVNPFPRKFSLIGYVGDPFDYLDMKNADTVTDNLTRALIQFGMPPEKSADFAQVVSLGGTIIAVFSHEELASRISHVLRNLGAIRVYDGNKNVDVFADTDMPPSARMPLTSFGHGDEELDPSEQANIQAFINAMDDAHVAAQGTIAAADRNLTLMHDIARELQTSVNILRWSNRSSNKFSTADQSAQSDDAQIYEGQSDNAQTDEAEPSEVQVAEAAEPAELAGV